MDQIKCLLRGSKYSLYHRPRLVWFQELPFDSAAASGNPNRGGRRAETRIAAVGEWKPGLLRSASGNPDRCDRRVETRIAAIGEPKPGSRRSVAKYSRSNVKTLYQLTSKQVEALRR